MKLPTPSASWNNVSPTQQSPGTKHSGDRQPVPVCTWRKNRGILQRAWDFVLQIHMLNCRVGIKWGGGRPASSDTQTASMQYGAVRLGWEWGRRPPVTQATMHIYRHYPLYFPYLTYICYCGVPHDKLESLQIITFFFKIICFSIRQSAFPYNNTLSLNITCSSLRQSAIPQA